MHILLRIEDSTASLYGRYIHDVKTRRLAYGEPLEFVKRGLKRLT